MINCLVLLVVLSCILAIYIRKATQNAILDEVNDRSSHQVPVVRGGGIIFPISMLVATIIYGNVMPYWSLLGLIALAITSFLDDFYGIRASVRLLVQLVANVLLVLAINQMIPLPIWANAIIVFVLTGFVNAFNFMDGINGITGLYSGVILLGLYYLNQKLMFVNDEYITFPLTALFVFLYFNYRKIAKCFAGDVGSITIAFWILMLLSLLVIQTRDTRFVLMLSVYGIDTFFTLILRALNKENIFKAHRKHLYQLLSNEVGMDQRVVAFMYAAIQGLLFIPLFVLPLSLTMNLVIIGLLAIVYLILKMSIYKKYYGTLY